MSVAAPLSRFDNPVVFIHPLVRAARRAAELAAIEKHRTRFGATIGPTVFAAASRQAARDPIDIRPDHPDPGPIATLADCWRWLAARGHPGFVRFTRGGYELNGRFFTEAALIGHIAARQRVESVGSAVIFDLLAGCAARGRHCPGIRVMDRFLRRRHAVRAARDGIETILEALARAGAIAIRRVGNRFIITILTGPHAGKQTANPPRATPLRAAA
jgi:hypothetical protein